ncbi:MAG: ABC transporter ATP-binding protein [Lentisphaeria bacterium]
MEKNTQKKEEGLRRIFVFIHPYIHPMIFLMIMTALMAFIAIVPPFVTRALIDRVFTNGERDIFFVYGLMMVMTWIIYLLISLVQSVTCVYIGQRFVCDVRNKLYNHILHLSLRFFGKNSAGKIVNRLMGDSNVLQQMLTGESMMVISDVIVALCAMVATFAINWRLSLLLWLILVFFVINFRMTRRRIVTTSRAMSSSYDRLSGGVQNRLVANLAVKTFGMESHENYNFDGDSEDALRLGKAQGIAGNTFGMNVNLIQTLGNSVLYFCGCAMVIRGEVTYGDVVAFNAFAMQMLGPAVRLSQLANRLQQVAISTDRIFEVFDEKSELPENPSAIEKKVIRGAVEFKDVWFHYDPGIEIIRGFNLKVEPGETIALIGPTGCGKSTILNLIVRYYDVTGGALLVDGIDIRNLDLHCYRQNFGIVLQESHLFSTSIRENIRYSRLGASDDEVVDAAKAAEIHDFIMTLDDKYDTPVGDFGVELSVGQKQRINIARAICAKPSILIMDEATSSLDSDSEQAIQRAMEKILVGRTSFVVAHRLSTIKNADKIILLDKGVVKECGKHDELMAMPNGQYRDLYTKHMSAGVLEE